MATPARSNGRRRTFAYAPQSAAGRYVRLLTVTITHTYYTQTRGLCRDFKIVPTPSTAQVMDTLGLLLKDEGVGFSVLIQATKLPTLIAWLHREAQAGADGPEYWSRLTFLLVLDNLEFVGVTALPINTKPTQVNLYGSNRTAHAVQSPETATDTAGIILPAGRFMGAESLYPVTGSTLNVPLPGDAAKVIVTDISGTVVLPQRGGHGQAVIFETPGAAAPKRASLDLSDLPYDLYTINVEDALGQPVASPLYPRNVLYVPADPMPMAVLDMLLTQPTPDAAGAYPIPPLFGGDPEPEALSEIAYRLPFDARHTYWEYYVVLQRPGRLGTLAIDDVPGMPPSGVTFQRDPKPAPLPDGSLAVRFSADGALPLRQNSALRFQLTGRWHDQAGDHPIQISPLSVAPSAPVWPGPDHRRVTGSSEMFVFV